MFAHFPHRPVESRGHLINFLDNLIYKMIHTFVSGYRQSYSVWRRAPFEPAVSHGSSLIFRGLFAGWRKGDLWMPFVS